jgi:hypothetical protein
MNETILGLLGLVLIIVFPIGLAIFIFLRSSRRIEETDPGLRTRFFALLAIILGGGAIAALGIFLKSDRVSIYGLGELGIIILLASFLLRLKWWLNEWTYPIGNDTLSYAIRDRYLSCLLEPFTGPIQAGRSEI